MSAKFITQDLRSTQPGPQWADRRGLVGGVHRHILFLVTLIYVCLIFAPEAAVNLGGANLTAYRIAVLALIVPAVSSIVKARGRLIMPDYLILFGSVWMIVSFLTHFDPLESLVRSFGIVVDAAGAYLIGRASIRSYDDLRRVLILIIPGLAGAGVILAIESLSHTMIYRPLWASVFGNTSAYVEGNAAGALQYRTDSRLGLMRAYSTFSHPILAGITLASFLPLIYMSGIRSWPLWLGIAAGFLGFFSVSSVTLLILAGAIGLVILDRLKRYFRTGDWRLVAALILVALALLHFSSENGVHYVIVRYTFDPHNGYVRIIQWESAAAALSATPWFGIAYERVPTLPEWLPASIDSHLFSLALRTGWPTSIAFYLAPIWIVCSQGFKIARHSTRERDLIVGLNFLLVLVLVGSLTVAFFGETNVLFMGIFGAAAALSQLQPNQINKANVAAVPIEVPIKLRPNSFNAG